VKEGTEMSELEKIAQIVEENGKMLKELAERIRRYEKGGKGKL